MENELLTCNLQGLQGAEANATTPPKVEEKNENQADTKRLALQHIISHPASTAGISHCRNHWHLVAFGWRGKQFDRISLFLFLSIFFLLVFFSPFPCALSL